MFGDDRRVRFQARHAVTLAPFASKENNRYYLTGIYVEPFKDGVLLVATDGHRLGLVYDKTGESNGKWICPIPKILRDACEADDSGEVHLIGPAGYVTDWPLDDDDDPTKIGEHHLAAAFAPAIEGNFPDFRRVLPREIPTEPVSFSRRYLNDFGAASLQIFPGDRDGPTYILRHRDPEFVGVLMPVKTDHDSTPTWFEESLRTCVPKPEEEAAE